MNKLKLKGKKPTDTSKVTSREVQFNKNHHVKVPVDAKNMLKMHVSHLIMQQLGINK